NGSVTVTVSSTAGTPSGSVSLSVDAGTPVSKVLSSGSATFGNTDIAALTSPSAGDHSLSASYAAQGNFDLSWKTASLHVNPAGTTMSITALDVTYPNDATVKVNVTSSGGTVTGNVSLSVDGGTPVSKALVNGCASFAKIDIAALGSPNAG